MMTTFFKKGIVVGVMIMMCMSLLFATQIFASGPQVPDPQYGGGQPDVTSPAPTPDVTSPAPTPDVTSPAPRPDVTSPAPNPPGVLLNPFRGGESLINLLRIILDQIILPIGSVVVVLMIIYSGFLFVTAQGNEAALTKAKNSFMWTIIGAAILLGAWTMGQVIQQTVCDISARPLPGLECGQ